MVPSYLLKPVVVDKSNWEKVLVDSGYYKQLAVRLSEQIRRRHAALMRRLAGPSTRTYDAMTAMLEMRGVSKSFAGVQALRDVNFTVEAGQIHALVGENGAGKSTLMKVLSGVYPARQL